MTRFRLTVFFVLLSAATSAFAEGKFQWKNDEEKGTADLTLGGKPVLRYMYAFDNSTPERFHETYKVYHHVFGPQSGEQITKGAGGQYTHHRGLYVGWRAVKVGKKSLDFWHCKNGVSLRHVKFNEMAGDATRGSMEAVIAWADEDGKTIVEETRRIVVARGDANQWVIEWTTSLVSKAGDIVLDGDHAHAGFQFRAANNVAETNKATYLRPDGFPQSPGATNPDNHNNLGWLAMTYPLGENRYTVEYFEDPSMPRPARFSERPYGRFGSFFKSPLGEKPLKMRYRLVVTEGETPTREVIQKRYESFKASAK